MDVDYIRDDVDHAVPFTVSLEVFSPRQGSTFDKTPLEVQVSLGDGETLTDAAGFGFGLDFVRVFVSVVVQRCEILDEPRYERELSPKEFSAFLKRIIEVERSTVGDASIDTNSIFSKILGMIGVDVRVHANVRAALNSGRLDSVESMLKYKIVKNVPIGRWQIGHQKLGDPTQLGGLLSGNYVIPLPNGEDPPLCEISPKRPVKTYRADIWVTAKKNDIRYRPTGGFAEGQLWEKLNKKKIEEILTLKMLQDQARRDGIESPKDEIILARGAITVKQKV